MMVVTLGQEAKADLSEIVKAESMEQLLVRMLVRMLELKKDELKDEKLVSL